MKNKYLKIMSIFAIAIVGFVLGTNKAEALTNSVFTFDYGFHYTLPDTLEPGVNDITINSAQRLKEDENKNLSDSTEYIINYKLTEVKKSVYDEFKKLQDQIFTQSNIENGLENKNQTVEAFEKLVNEKYKKDELWCYNKPTKGKITVKTDCETKYYVLSVDVEAKDTKVGDKEFNWEYMTAKAYEVKGDTAACPKCKIEGNKYYDQSGKQISEAEYNKQCTTPDNPKTGISTPYIISGAVVLGAIAIIIISMKKKFI